MSDTGLIDAVGASADLSQSEHRQAQLRFAKDRLNAATSRLLAGDQAAVAEAEHAQQAVNQIQAGESASSDEAAQLAHAHEQHA